MVLLRALGVVAGVQALNYKYGEHCARNHGITSQEMAAKFREQKRQIVRFLLMQGNEDVEEHKVKLASSSELEQLREELRKERAKTDEMWQTLQSMQQEQKLMASLLVNLKNE